MSDLLAISIRPATPSDAAVIAEFNACLARETEGKQLHPQRVADGVRTLLENERHGRYFLAEADGRPVGQIMHTREWSDWRNGEFWWLQSVFVRPECRRQGVFRGLMQHMLKLARHSPGVVGLRLYMADDNLAARKTYENCGFACDGYVVLEQLLSDELNLPRIQTE